MASKRRNFIRTNTKVNGPFNTYQIDIIDYGSLSRINSGIKYLLCIIDCFTRYAYVYKMKYKNADNNFRALQLFFNQVNIVPRFIYSDGDLAFLNSKVQSLFNRYGILHVVLKSGHKASIVERFNRTIKTNIALYLEENDTKRYVGALDDLVHAYNNRIHRSTGMTPISITLSNFRKVYKKLYPHQKRHFLCSLKVGDTVRVALKKGTFQKGYEQNFSTQLYKVKKVYKTSKTCIYIIVDTSGHRLKKYYEELKLVHTNDISSTINGI